MYDRFAARALSSAASAVCPVPLMRVCYGLWGNGIKPSAPIGALSGTGRRSATDRAREAPPAIEPRWQNVGWGPPAGHGRAARRAWTAEPARGFSGFPSGACLPFAAPETRFKDQNDPVSHIFAAGFAHKEGAAIVIDSAASPLAVASPASKAPPP